MTVRLSQAFASFRALAVAEAMHDLTSNLVPEFNSEIEDIRVEHDKMKPESEALADHKRRSRIHDLKIRQQDFIAGLNQELEKRMLGCVSQYKGTIEEITIPNPKKEGETKVVLEAKFPDGSHARVPKGLWIDYHQFQRA